MDKVICKRCQLQEADFCCICEYPIPSYCSTCLEHHIYDPSYALTLHHKLPLSALASIDSKNKQKNLKSALSELGECQQSAKQINDRLESVKEVLGDFFDKFIWEMRQYQAKIMTQIDEMNLQAADTLAASMERISAFPLAAGEEIATVTSTLAEIYSSLDGIQHCLTNCSPETAARAVISHMAIAFPEYQQLERVKNIDLVLCLPSRQAIGTFTFNIKAKVQEIHWKIEEMKGLPRFQLYFGNMQMNEMDRLEEYPLPLLAVIDIYPLIVFKSALLSESMYISDTHTVRSLKESMRGNGRDIGEYHHFLCDNQVLDDDFLLINAGKDSIFGLFLAEKPQESLLIRDENSEIIELPIFDLAESFLSLKRRIAEKIRYEEECQRLSFYLQELEDDSSLRSVGAQGGSVIDLERLVHIYVVIPAIGTPFCITIGKKQASVLMVKVEIQRRLSLPPDNQHICVRDRELVDEEMLCSDFRSTCTVNLIMTGYLLASMHSNEYVAVVFQGGDEVTMALKLRIADRLALQADLCQLVCDGRRLNNAATLASAGVTEGCLVTVFLSEEEEEDPALGSLVGSMQAMLQPGAGNESQRTKARDLFGDEVIEKMKLMSASVEGVENAHLEDYKSSGLLHKASRRVLLNEYRHLVGETSSTGSKVPYFLPSDPEILAYLEELEGVEGPHKLKVTIKYGEEDMVMQHLDREMRIVMLKEILRLRLGVPVAQQELINGVRTAENEMQLKEFSPSGAAGIIFRLKRKR